MAVCIVLCALLTLCVTACDDTDSVERHRDEIDSWVKRGYGALSEAQQPDSALVYFTRAASMYSPNLDAEAKQSCVRAYVGKWVVFFSYLFDYPQAYEALQRAMEICESSGLDKSHVEVSMGGMLQVLAEQSDSQELYDMAADYYTSGLRHAIASHRLNDADRAFINLLGLASPDGLRPEVGEVWEEYNTLRPGPADHRRRLAHTMFHALHGDRGALLRLEGEADALPDEAEYERLRFIAYQTASQIRGESGNLTEAIRIIEKADNYARARGILDGEIEAIRSGEQWLRLCGEESKADSMRVRYLRLKERFLNSRQITRLNELRFLSDIRKNAEQIESMQSTMHMQLLLIILFVLLGIAVGSLLWVYFTKNRSLQKAYDTLYQNLRDKIEAGERARGVADECKLQSEQPDSGEPESDRGVETRLIDKETGKAIMTAVEEVMNDAANFCTPDFSLSRLSDMVGYNSKYVAYAIKEERGCNFSSYVNARRVLEASGRMIKGGEWHQYTLEAVAHAVGFKSRSSFLSAFKQHTGMTPSEFKRRAENE